MDRIKILIITVVITTSAAILFYLIYISKLYDKYTSAGAGGSTIVVYTNEDGTLSDGRKLSSLLDDMKSALKNSNIDVVITDDSNKIKNMAVDEVKYGNKITVFDVNCSKLVVNKNTVLMRIPPADEFKYDDAYLSKLKEKMNVESIKLNVLNYKKGENVISNSVLLKIDVSNSCDAKTAQSLITNTIINILNLH